MSKLTEALDEIEKLDLKGVVKSPALNGLLCAVAEQLEEAAELIQHWGDYSAPCFQEKYDLKGDVNKFKTYAALVREVTGI